MLPLSGVAPRNFVQVGSPTGVAEVKRIPPSAPVTVPDKSKPLTSTHDVDVAPDANGMFGTQASGMPEGRLRLQVARFMPQTIPTQSLYTTVATSSKARPALSRLLLFQICATGPFIRVHLSLPQGYRWFFLCARELEQFSWNRCRI